MPEYFSIVEYDKDGNAILDYQQREYVGDVRFCDTLEPATSGIAHPAIPKGTYQINVVWSPKFKGYYPRLENVPSRSGILIHSGNYAKDTLGCILVGANTLVGGLTGSRDTFRDLFECILKAVSNRDLVTIKIVDV